MSDCTCTKHENGRTWVRECPEHGEAAIEAKLLNPGTPVRSVRHPELTGRIKCWEWHSPGHISPIPYNVEWDDNERAYDVLGMFWIYQDTESVEALPVEAPAA
jgi:hypothetical protein